MSPISMSQSAPVDLLWCYLHLGNFLNSVVSFVTTWDFYRLTISKYQHYAKWPQTPTAKYITMFFVVCFLMSLFPLYTVPTLFTQLPLSPCLLQVLLLPHYYVPSLPHHHHQWWHGLLPFPNPHFSLRSSLSLVTFNPVPPLGCCSWSSDAVARSTR